mmetsp:Transcript_33381/g.53486  ORF Transcript_33381/g.53486 Transcript_33381/m.53486 type:complete len:91 (-) Transcript_33381:162-434(-)
MSIGGVYLAGFPEEQQTELAHHAMSLMFQDQQHKYLTATNYCFGHCVQNFTDREIQKGERVCVEACVDKYFATWDRSLQRVQQVIAPKLH